MKTQSSSNSIENFPAHAHQGGGNFERRDRDFQLSGHGYHDELHRVWGMIGHIEYLAACGRISCRKKGRLHDVIHKGHALKAALVTHKNEPAAINATDHSLEISAFAFTI